MKDDQACVDTFTIRHPSVHISTTSVSPCCVCVGRGCCTEGFSLQSQYAMLLDIVNNLLLYKEPRQKELTETMERLRFTLQLSNIEDCRTLILARQERVRCVEGGDGRCEEGGDGRCVEGGEGWCEEMVRWTENVVRGWT